MQIIRKHQTLGLGNFLGPFLIKKNKKNEKCNFEIKLTKNNQCRIKIENQNIIYKNLLKWIFLL